jgi:hypothetical protein
MAHVLFMAADERSDAFVANRSPIRNMGRLVGGCKQTEKQRRRVQQTKAEGEMKRVTNSAIIVAVVSAVALIGGRAFADDAGDIEAFYGTANPAVNWDNTSGDYPVITYIGSQPGFFGGHTFTGWSIFAQDNTGGMEIFTSAATLSNIPPGNTYTNPAAGDAITLNGTYSPFDGIPEIEFSTVPASNHNLVKISGGNAVPAPPVFTIAQLEAGTANGAGVLTNPAIAGMIIELQGVTISGSTGSFQSTFPLETQANIVDEAYTITQGSSTLEMFDWTTSYSVCAARGGTAVPTGPQNMIGFFDSFNEFVPLSIVPEPSTFMLAGVGLIGGLLTMRRRRR